MYTSLHRQAGLTMISIVAILMLIAFFVLLTLKIGPIYLNHFKVTDSLASMEADQYIQSQSKPQIKQLLLNRFDINMVDYVTKDEITVEKRGDYVKVAVSYEVVKPLFGNLDVLVYFDDEIEVGAI